MSSFGRMLLVAIALLSSGVLQVAAAVSEDTCCPGEAQGGDEQDASCPGCPLGVTCACAPIRGAPQASAIDVAPATSRGVAVAVATAEPALGASAADIFHPPRA